jgi:hypothetical protein
MDYESKAKELILELNDGDALGTVNHHVDTEDFLRKLAAEVLMEAAKEYPHGKFVGPVLMAEVVEWLERRAREIEGGQ